MNAEDRNYADFGEKSKNVETEFGSDTFTYEEIGDLEEKEPICSEGENGFVMLDPERVMTGQETGAEEPIGYAEKVEASVTVKREESIGNTTQEETTEDPGDAEIEDDAEDSGNAECEGNAEDSENTECEGNAEDSENTECEGNAEDSGDTENTENSGEAADFELTLDDVKMWLFRESVRQMEEREQLRKDQTSFEQEQKDEAVSRENREFILSVKERQIEMKQELVEKKLAVLEKEYLRLDQAKKEFEEEKRTYEQIRKYTRPVQNITYIGTDFLFQGVDNEVALKKRYRDLLKIFHPDNMGGDTDIIQDINKEYDKLRKKYS